MVNTSRLEGDLRRLYHNVLSKSTVLGGNGATINFIANVKATNVFANLLDNTGIIPANSKRDFGWDLFRCLACHDFLIDGVNTTCVNLDQYFVRFWLRYFNI